MVRNVQHHAKITTFCFVKKCFYKFFTNSRGEVDYFSTGKTLSTLEAAGNR